MNISSLKKKKTTEDFDNRYLMNENPGRLAECKF